MQSSSPFDFFRRNQDVTNLTAYFLVGVMSTCLLLVLVNLGEQVQLGWNGTYVRFFGILVIIEALVARQVIESFDENKGLLFRLSELGLIVFGLKVAQLMGLGLAGITDQFESWQTNFWSFFDGEFLLCFTLIILVWAHATRYVQLLSVLNSYQSDLEIAEFVQLRAEREDARTSMVNLFLAVGVVLILIITMIRTDVAFLEKIRGELISHAVTVQILPLVIFFLCGIILLSLSRFSILRGGWLISKLPIQQEIAANWFKFAVLFFGVVVLLTLFLPTSYTSGFLSTSMVILQFFVEGVMFLIGLLIFPFVWLYSLIMSLLPESNNEPPTANIPQFEMPEQTQTTAATMPGWFQIVQHIFFWVVLLVLIILIVRHYYKENKGFLEKVPLFGVVKKWLSAFWLWVKRTGKRMTTSIPKLGSDQERVKPRSSSFINWFSESGRADTPRAVIIKRYLTFLEQSGKLGLKKKTSATPTQFANVLNHNLPEENQDDAAQITTAFIQARYSLEEVRQVEAERLEPLWKRILQQLKHRLGE